MKKDKISKKKKTFDKVKRFWLIIIAVIFIVVLVVLSFAIFGKNSKLFNRTAPKKEIIDKIVDIDGINDLVGNKKNAIIYFYDSASENTINMEIKNYLDQSGVVYYLYDKAEIDTEEYKKFLKMFNIDIEVFGLPAIININDGEMFGNIININDINNVKTFVDDYELVSK